MSEWQPIETAPTDGTPIIFANFEAICLLTGMPHVWSGRLELFEGDEEPTMLECSHAAININGEPTHWMLPPDNPDGWQKYGAGDLTRPEPPK